MTSWTFGHPISHCEMVLLINQQKKAIFSSVRIFWLEQKLKHINEDLEEKKLRKVFQEILKH
jgi:hypothetical protein